MESSQASPIGSLTPAASAGRAEEFQAPAGTGSARPRRPARATHGAAGHEVHTPAPPTNTVTPSSCSHQLLPPPDLDSQVFEEAFRAILPVVRFHFISSSLLLRFALAFASLCVCTLACVCYVLLLLWLVSTGCVASLQVILGFVSLMIEASSWVAFCNLYMAISQSFILHSRRSDKRVSAVDLAVGLPMLALKLAYICFRLLLLLTSLLRVSKWTMWRSAFEAVFNIFTETLEIFYVTRDFNVTYHLFDSSCSKMMKLVTQSRESMSPVGETATAVSVDYNIRRDDFAKLHRDLRSSLPSVGAVRVNDDAMVGAYRKFELTPPSRVDRVRGTLILSEQRKNMPPNGWILVNFVGENWWLDRTTIAVREDNLYHVAFTNNAGRWFVFEGCEGQFPAAAIIRSSMLPFGGGYQDLVAGGHKNLTDLPLSRQAALDAVKVLASHRCYEDAVAMLEKKWMGSWEDSSLSKRHKEYYLSKFEGDDYCKKLRDALATTLVLVAEAARFKSIHDTVREGWQQEHAEVNISEQEANMVVFWGSISLTSLNWAEFGKFKLCRDVKRSRDINFEAPDEALRELNLVLWPKGFKFGGNRSSQMICHRPAHDREFHWC